MFDTKSIILIKFYLNIWYMAISWYYGNLIKSTTFKGQVEFTLALEFTFSSYLFLKVAFLKVFSYFPSPTNLFVPQKDRPSGRSEKKYSIISPMPLLFSYYSVDDIAAKFLPAFWRLYVCISA